MINLQKVKEQRKKAGITQEDMAKKLGFRSKSGYAMIENGNNNFKLKQAKIVADTLETTIDELFFDNKCS